MSGYVPLAVALGNLSVWESLRKGAFPQAQASISFHRKVSLPSSELMHDLATVLTDSANRMLKDSLFLTLSHSIFVALSILLTHTDHLSLDLSILHQPSLLLFLCMGLIVSELSKERHSLIFLSLTFICSPMKYSIINRVPFGQSSHDMCSSAHFYLRVTYISLTMRKGL